LYGQESCLPRSNSHSKTRERRPVATSVGRGYPTKSQASNSGVCRRQFEWHEETRQVRRVGSSTMPFSFDPKIPNPISQTTTFFEGWSLAGRYLPVNTSSSRDAQRALARHFHRSTDPISQESLHCISYSSYGARIPIVHKLLPNISNTSGTQSTIHNQHHRINEFHYPGLIAAKPFCFKPPSTSTMGDSTDSITKEIKLQWQTSSTELINPTPHCDLKNSAGAAKDYRREGVGTSCLSPISQLAGNEGWTRSRLRWAPPE
jgi:hypothetical protein